MDEGGGVVGRAVPMPLVHAIVNNMCGLATNLYRKLHGLRSINEKLFFINTWRTSVISF